MVTELIQGLKDIDYGEVTTAISEFLDGLDIVGIMVDWFSLKVDILVESIGGLLTTAQGWDLFGIAIGGLLLKGLGSALGAAGKVLLFTFGNALLSGNLGRWFTSVTKIASAGLTLINTQIQLIGTALSPILTTIGQIVSAVAPFVALIAGIGVAVVEFVDQFQTGMEPVKMLIEGIGIAVAAIGAILLGAPAAITAIIAAVVYLVSAVVLAIHDN